jgi:hypothetical protein
VHIAIDDAADVYAEVLNEAHATTAIAFLRRDRYREGLRWAIRDGQRIGLGGR